MKTYRHELTGAIKGNSRLRRRLDEANERVARLERNVMFLVAKLDAMGHGDDEGVRKCAWSVGWFRSPEVARKVREAME